MPFNAYRCCCCCCCYCLTAFLRHDSCWKHFLLVAPAYLLTHTLTIRVFVTSHAHPFTCSCPPHDLFKLNEVNSKLSFLLPLHSLGGLAAWGRCVCRLAVGRLLSVCLPLRLSATHLTAAVATRAGGGASCHLHNGTYAAEAFGRMIFVLTAALYKCTYICTRMYCICMYVCLVYNCLHDSDWLLALLVCARLVAVCVVYLPVFNWQWIDGRGGTSGTVRATFVCFVCKYLLLKPCYFAAGF